MIGNFYILDDKIFEIQTMDEKLSVQDLELETYSSINDAEDALIDELTNLISIYETKIEAIKIKRGLK